MWRRQVSSEATASFTAWNEIVRRYSLMVWEPWKEESFIFQDSPCSLLLHFTVTLRLALTFIGLLPWAIHLAISRDLIYLKVGAKVGSVLLRQRACLWVWRALELMQRRRLVVGIMSWEGNKIPSKSFLIPSSSLFLFYFFRFIFWLWAFMLP